MGSSAQEWIRDKVTNRSLMKIRKWVCDKTEPSGTWQFIHLKDEQWPSTIADVEDKEIREGFQKWS